MPPIKLLRSIKLKGLRIVLAALVEAGLGHPCDAMRQAQPAPWSADGS